MSDTQWRGAGVAGGVAREGAQVSFDSLAQLDPRALDQVFATGTTPSLEDVAGREFRGWFVNPAARLIGTRKFAIGFFGDASLGHIWGYSAAIEQGSFSAPWTPRRGDGPRHRFFFGARPATHVAGAKHTHALVLAAREWRDHSLLNPLRGAVGYVVKPEPTNNGLLLGKCYLELGPLRPVLGHFVLEDQGDAGYAGEPHDFTSGERRTVEAFAEVFIEGAHEAISPRDIARNIERQLERIESSRKASLRLALFMVEHILPRRSWWPFRRPFSKMTRAARRAFVQNALTNASVRGPVRDLAKLRALFAVGCYGDARSHPSIGFVSVPQRARFKRDTLKVLPTPALPLHDPVTSEVECDVCVIGSGAGGAVVAHGLAAAGRDVIVLEEGPYVPPSATTHDEPAMTARLYKEGGLQTTIDLDMAVLQGKCLGGATTFNNAICFRLGDTRLTPTPDPLDAWERLGAQINRTRLDKAFDEVERFVGVGPLDGIQDGEVPFIGGENGKVLLEGWRARAAGDPSLDALRHGWFVKNKNRCLGCGYCNFGCPYGRKLSTVETYLPAAAAAGARIIVDCHAVGIERTRVKATSVRCIRRDGRPLRVRARHVVLACGTIGSSVLLMKSGIGRNVGRRVSFNAGSPVFARFPRPIHAFDGIQMAAYVDTGDAMLESLFNPPMAFAATMPGWFDTYFSRMREYARFASAGALIATESNGRVKRTSGLRQLFGPLDYAMTGSDLATLRRAIATLAEIYFAAGAETVLPATFADAEMTAAEFASRPERILPFLQDRIREPEDLTLSSAHPQGGNAMSDDPAVGTVDGRFRVYGMDNVYICDASVFPNAIRINPQITVMALSRYFVTLGTL